MDDRYRGLMNQNPMSLMSHRSGEKNLQVVSHHCWGVKCFRMMNFQGA
jgi:hypothetical protein